MMTNPLVSILIPLYNAEKYFTETMESLLAQTYENIEIIIVDDGSTDNSLKIARKYEKQYENIKIYTQENSGASTARNKAFEKSSGEYLQYFDADDIMHPNKIISQVETLKKYSFDPMVVATGKWTRFYRDIDGVIFQQQITDKNYMHTLSFLRDAWDNFHYVIGPSWLISRELHERVGQWSVQLSVNDDGEFFARVAYYAKKILFIPESKVYWRQDNQSSLSQNITRNGMQSHLQVCHSFAEIVKDHLDYPGMKHALAMEYSKCIYRSYPKYMDIVKEAEAAIKNLGFDKPLPMPTGKFRLATKIIGFYPTARLFGAKDKFVKIIRKLMDK